MRKGLFVALVLVLLVSGWFTPAKAINLSSVLVKKFVTDRWSGKLMTVKIEIVTPLKSVNTTEEFRTFKRLLDIHKQAVRAFARQGWQEYLAKEVAADFFAGSVVVMVEGRMNLKFKEKTIIKTFILPCDPDPLWSTFKYRGGGLDNYFQSIERRSEICIKEKYGFR